ncbi:TetR family transcriptional regulator [Amycolatopsis sulphurea]|uniref:TetR family transcriptional regulator n=1 Tax=Amycolatopsis sulphurea TaxID=76022 RepID=A0A2A9FJ93_9PSEU|nr:TetR family transcriptional regulator [Amycolatopsis sulphurea]PFG50642.1 TetR family transcriptional regulator [Amycolatopsis sulphurea]
MNPEDGRAQRGARRRALLIAATVRVIARDGVTGVTHRSVAIEAGLPGSAVSHHFASTGDLLAATLRSGTDELVTTMESPGTATVPGFARELVRLFEEESSAVKARYELYLRAGRQPETRESARLWLDLLAATARTHTADPARAAAWAAAVDGYFVQHIADGSPPDAAELARLLHAVLA